MHVVLDDADITSTSGPAIDVREADEVVAIAAYASTNALTGGAESSAALDSSADLIIGGDPGHT